MTKKPRPLTPKKLFEAWFSVFLGDQKIGHDWIFWEPHGDGTAWFERRVQFAAPAAGLDVDAHCQARFAARTWPDLRWLRFRDHAEKTEMALEGSRELRPGVAPIPVAGDLLPHFLLPLVAAAAPTAAGETIPFSMLEERDHSVTPGYTLVSHGPETIEAAGAPYETTRFTVEREGRVLRTAWIDANRRIRKIDYGGPFAVLTTRDAAIGGEIQGT